MQVAVYELFINNFDFTEFIADFEIFGLLFTWILTMTITLWVMPKIILISKKKNLTALPNDRTSHEGVVPTLGGIGIFIGVLVNNSIAGLLFANYTQLNNLIAFNLLLLLLLLLGVRDDIMTLNARKKFIFQIGIAVIFPLTTGIYIDSFDGLFNLQQIPPVPGTIFTVFVIVLIINAYNLIDGIDGLAGALGVIISGMLAMTFYLSGHMFAAVMSMGLVGALTAFLVYNFSRRMKIFLGDTGSMVVGFMLAVQVVVYLNISSADANPVYENAPIFVMALLSYPLLDTLRVFIVRIKNGGSPFKADRNHIHHRLIDLGMRHAYATITVAGYTVIITTAAYLLNGLSITIAFLILLPVAMALLGLPYMIKPSKKVAGVKMKQFASKEKETSL